MFSGIAFILLAVYVEMPKAIKTTLIVFGSLLILFDTASDRVKNGITNIRKNKEDNDER